MQSCFFLYNWETGLWTTTRVCEERSTIAYPCSVYPSRWHPQMHFHRDGGLEVPGCWNSVWWGGREGGAILTNLRLRWHVSSVMHGYKQQCLFILDDKLKLVTTFMQELTEKPLKNMNMLNLCITTKNQAHIHDYKTWLRHMFTLHCSHSKHLYVLTDCSTIQEGP